MGKKVNVSTSKIASEDLIDNLSTNGMDVRYNSVLCISGIAWLKRSLQ